MTTAVAAPAPGDDDGEVVERTLCRCGRLAEIVRDGNSDSCWHSATCPCGDFIPADAGSARP